MVKNKPIPGVNAGAVEVACRLCGAQPIHEIVDLGNMPLANALLPNLESDRGEPTYPLVLALCSSCSLVQITETVPAEKLFSDYVYFSSYSETVLKNAEDVVAKVLRMHKLGPDSLVVEIASNDGYLLQNYRHSNIPVLGIEPAANIAKVAQEKRDVRSISEFFTTDLARRLADEGYKPDVIHANNVLAHVADLNGFVEGLSILMNDSSLAVIEVPYVRDLIDHCEFDTIYHEHLCYFSMLALVKLFRRHGLIIKDVEKIPIHGGSLRLFVTQEAGNEPGETVVELLREEADLGMDGLAFYQNFADRISGIKTSLIKLLKDLKQSNKKIGSYGAAAKGAILLNYCGVGTETIDFVADRSPYKQGKLMPGIHIPICAPSQILSEMPDYVLLLAWNFADEVISQYAEYMRLGGKFIIPIPDVRICQDGGQVDATGSAGS